MKKLTREKSLALKITAVSIVGMLFLMSLIIGSSYVYQKNINIRNFIEESNRANIQNILSDEEKNTIPEMQFLGPKRRLERGPRDILVLNENGNIVANSFGEVGENAIERIQKSLGKKDITIEMMGRTFFVTQRRILGYNVFFFYDLTPLIQFHSDLFMIALLGGLLSLVGIYLMAEYLARITIAPIKKHNESLSAYSHNVAHELKTPLSIMKSDIEIIALKYPNISLESLGEEVRTMQNIIDGLLLLANPEKETNTEKMSVETILENLLKRYPDTQTISLEKDSAKRKPVPKILFERLLVNLIENAQKHGTGSITISLFHDTLTIKNAIEAPISKEELEKLTQVFYQSDTSRHTGGHGLGLALVKKITEMLGYTLKLSCEKNIFSATIRLK